MNIFRRIKNLWILSGRIVYPEYGTIDLRKIKPLREQATIVEPDRIEELGEYLKKEIKNV